MFTKMEVWLKLFVAALQAFLHEPGTTTSSALNKARAAADEGLTHMPVDMTEEESLPMYEAHCPKCNARLEICGNDQVKLTTPAPVITDPPAADPSQSEDELERARR